MKKFLFFLVLLIILIAIFYVYKKVAKAPIKQMDSNYQIIPTPASFVTPSLNQINPNTQTSVKGNTGKDYTPPGNENAGESGGSDIQVYEVGYNGKIFMPAIIKIKVGDYIFFKNTGSGDFWPLSSDADHLSLNSGKTILAGAQYKFEFTKAGTWNYSDKFNTTAIGKVVVE